MPLSSTASTLTVLLVLIFNLACVPEPVQLVVEPDIPRAARSAVWEQRGGVLGQIRVVPAPPPVLPRAGAAHPAGLRGGARQQIQAPHCAGEGFSLPMSFIQGRILLVPPVVLGYAGVCLPLEMDTACFGFCCASPSLESRAGETPPFAMIRGVGKLARACTAAFSCLAECALGRQSAVDTLQPGSICALDYVT